MFLLQNVVRGYSRTMKIYQRILKILILMIHSYSELHQWDVNPFPIDIQLVAAMWILWKNITILLHNLHDCNFPSNLPPANSNPTLNFRVNFPLSKQAFGSLATGYGFTWGCPGTYLSGRTILQRLHGTSKVANIWSLLHCSNFQAIAKMSRITFVHSNLQ